ncbi:hypothetical protein [Blastococcus sp. CCUG 61487]|uniref:hypothetical protein n=1 Tax=Blastococcus sp. CCUG 61487 TaxID=1840703 RepID=UPI0010C00538|nr:hypothetical protein [Blastococcus sp. CCUG 61487]TKJ18180.1 hypothetical protein A6V29_11890 [Blastococcus sp. CCUG 61487]
MILGAALLLLVGLGLFVAGVLTGETAFYWSCVGACVVAAVLLVIARVRMAPDRPARNPAKDAVPAGAPRQPGGSTAASATSPPATTPSSPPATSPATTPASTAADPVEAGEPPVEEVEVTDLLLVVDLQDEVLVVDEHPRYHVAGCRHLTGRTTIPIPLDEARTDGFTPCGVCRPDATLAAQVRARKQATED